MKKIHIVTDKKRLQKMWGNILKNHYTVSVSSGFEDVIYAVNEDDYVIFEGNSPSADLYEKIEGLKKCCPMHHMLILRELPTLQEGEFLMSKGIGGYGNANMTDVILLQALEIITSGNIWLYPALMSHIVKKMTSLHHESKSEVLEHLTKREQEVAQLVARGESNKDIASDLSISLNTVKLHLAAIFHKLHIKNRVSLAVMVDEGSQG